MRTIKQIPNIAKETDFTKFPDSTILNEYKSQEGTPVVREIYGDLLTNVYKFLRDRGEIPSGIEDNELNGYQLLNALKKNTNTFDVQHFIDKNDNDLSIDIDFNLLPNKYILFAKAGYDFEDSLTFMGMNITTNGFSSGDNVIMYKDTSVIYIQTLGSANNDNNIETNSIGIPISYTSTNDSIYFDGESIIKSDFTKVDIKGLLQTISIDLIPIDVVFTNGVYIILAANTTKFLFFTIDHNNEILPLVLSGKSIGTSTNNMRMYANKDGIYLSHDNNTTTNAYSLSFFTYNSNTLTYVNTLVLNVDFKAPANYFVNDGNFVICEGGNIVRYKTDRTKTIIGSTSLGIPKFYTKYKRNYYQLGEIGLLWR